MNQQASRPTGGATANLEQKPLLTAIVATHNRESFIRECLCGLFDQTMADRMEVIVVDQGSEQSEWAVVADLQRRYPNLVSLRVPALRGTGAALNLALKLASGRYLTVVEATDRLRDDACELLMNALDAEPDAMAAYGDTFFTSIPHESFANHTSCGNTVWPEYTVHELSRLSQVAPHPMWRRALNDIIGGFDERHDTDAMRDFLLKASERFRMLHVREFTGLKLVPAGTDRDGVQREIALRHQGEQPLAEPAEPMPHATPAAAAEQQPGGRLVAGALPTSQTQPSADQAYDGLHARLEGASDLTAAKEIGDHLTRYPDHALAHNDLAAFSYRLGDTANALKHYRIAVELDPAEDTFQKNLADLCFVEGNVDESINIYLNVFKRSPRDVETLLNLGIISESVGHAEEAEAFYQRALELEPWNQEVRLRITEMRERLSEEETGALAAAGGADDESAEELYEQAQELVAREDFNGAFLKLQGIVDHYPDFAPAYNDLAVLYYQDGDKEKALTNYERATALAPGNSTFQKNLADFYFVEGHDVDGAIGIYLALLEKEPRNVETLFNLGRICTALDRPEEAKSFYGKVTQLEPWNREARECLSSLRSCANA